MHAKTASSWLPTMCLPGCINMLLTRFCSLDGASAPPLAAEAGLADNSRVDLTLEDGKLVVSPRHEIEYDLQNLLSQVSEENLYGEYDTGRSTGREAW
jgi:antitoxin MazE